MVSRAHTSYRLRQAPLERLLPGGQLRLAAGQGLLTLPHVCLSLREVRLVTRVWARGR